MASDDAAVTFPAAERRRQLNGTELCCLMRGVHGSEQLAQCHYQLLSGIRHLLIASPTSADSGSHLVTHGPSDPLVN